MFQMEVKDMKRLMMGMVFATALSASAYELYPTYVVTTTDEGTNELSSATVEMTPSEGAASTPVAFAALDKSKGNFHGTFVKRGVGFLRSCNAMTNFTGEIVIENGVLMADMPGDLGPFDSKLAPTVTVTRTGTAWFTGSQMKKAHFYNRFKLGGPGYRGLGAIHCALQSSQNDYMFYGPWNLYDDTTVASSTPYRYDLYSFDWYLNDHTLTVTNFGGSAADTALWTYSSKPQPGAGHIKVYGMTLSPHASTWGGAESNTLTFCNGAVLASQAAKAYIYWTANFLGNNSVRLSGSTDTRYGDNSADAYYGPFNVSNGTVTVQGTTVNKGYTFAGPVGGDGNIRATRSWLLFRWRGNDFHGAVSTDSTNSKTTSWGGGIGLFDPRAIDDRAKSFALTNAPLVVYSDTSAYLPGEYRLPKTVFHVDADTNAVIAVAKNFGELAEDTHKRTRLTLAGLRKTGAGPLEVRTVLNVTGVVDIAEGTVKLLPPVPRKTIYSVSPGLDYANHETNRLEQAFFGTRSDWGSLSQEYKAYQNFRTAGYSFVGQGVAPSVFMANVHGSPYWHNYMTVCYQGYLWNRTGTNVTWRFAGAVNDAFKFYVDGSSVGGLYDSSGATFNNKSLTNGPHKIEIVLWNRQTAGGARTPTTKHPFWNVPDMGFAICLEGGTSTNAVDYIAPCNGTEGIVNPGGDGFYFTRDARWPEEITDAEREAFWEREQTMIAGLRLSAAGTLDLNGGTNSVSTLEGVGTVANGSLVVKDRLTLGYGEVSGGQPLSVGGKLTFADGARIVFDGAFDKTPKDAQRNLTLVTAAEGIVNPPEIEDAAGNDRWRFAVSSDGKSLKATYNPRGTMLIVR